MRQCPGTTHNTAIFVLRELAKGDAATLRKGDTCGVKP